MRHRAAIAGLSLVLLSCIAFAAEKPGPRAEFRYRLLQVQFDEPMQIWQNARIRDLVRLDPALPATCHWQSDTELQCLPDEEKSPAGATRYRIHIAPGLKTQSGQVLPAQTLEVETERPTLSAEINGWDGGKPNIIFTTSLPSTADDVAAALRLDLDGQALPRPELRMQPVRGRWDTESRFDLVLPTIAGADKTLTLRVAPGLKTSEGPLRGRQDATLLRAVINEHFQLRGVVCAGRTKALSTAPLDGELHLECVPGEKVRLLFSQPLQDDPRSAWIQAWPVMAKWQQEGTENSWRYRYRDGKNDEPQRSPAYWIDLQVDAANVDLTLPIPALRNKNEDAALESALVHLRTDDFRPALRATHARTLIADGGTLPAMVEALNATSASIEVHGVGAKSRSETVAISTSRSNQLVAIASAVAARALDEGGWVAWSPQVQRGKPSVKATVQFAAPAFDLFAVSGRREVLAWANGWNDGRPVADAEVELLWLDAAGATPRVVAQGRTQQDGTALLNLRDDLTVADVRSDSTYPMWLLRAASGKRAHAPRAVLPIGSTQAWGMNLGRADEEKLWGVADRPLYRAGDTVRYHLWLRDDSGGRLLHPRQIAPVPLRLSRQWHEETILGWNATPDHNGGISGELVLPIHLPDDTYCIGKGENYELEGSCFYVGTYRAQDLWAETSMDDRVLRDGDRLKFDVSAGYYSGGPAAGVPIEKVTALLEGLPLEQAYPRYADYRFTDTTLEDGAIRIAGAEALKLVADTDGHARGDLPVAFDSGDVEEQGETPAFGRLRLTAEVKLGDRESTVASPVSTRYAHFDRFVGLRLQPAWLDATTPVSMEGIVIDAEGREIVDAAIKIEVRYLPGFSDDKPNMNAPVIKRCALRSKQMTDCTFAREKSGRYHVTARSGDAAPTELTRYVWVDSNFWRSDARHTELELLQAPAKSGDKVRVLLKQASDHAQALFVFVADNHILGHRVATITGTAQPFELETSTDWPSKIHLLAYVRPDMAAVAGENGLRKPVDISRDEVVLSLTATRPSIALSFETSAAKPGETVRIILRNDSARPRDVVLSVVDDALRTLADDVLAYFDPHGEYWLGDVGGYFDIDSASFGGWNDGIWRWWLPWSEAQSALGDEAANAAQAAADAAAGNGPVSIAPGAINPIDVASVESTTIRAQGNAGADREVTNVALLAPGTVRATPLPPPPKEPPVVFDEPSPVDAAAAAPSASTLDTVTVVGTGAINPAGIFEEGKPRVGDLRPREEHRTLRALARVRTQFADTALWQPDIHLAPGEPRSVELKVPDNLTRWRALAWSSDADDDFAMAEATLEVGLPVEVRLQTPVRIYPGDRSRLAANVRQVGDSAVQAAAQLRVEGGDVALDHAQPLPLVARGQGSFGAEIAPQRTGSLLVTASAQTPAGQDAVAAPIDVASSWINARKVQAGWLGDVPLHLDLPTLPAGASDAQLQLSLLRGNAGLVERWTSDLRDYAHRCWEQILSRAVAAALAVERGAGKDWPEAAAVVQEALTNAAVFQNQEGDFRYFTEASSFGPRDAEPTPQVALTAYSVQAFALLRELGHPVPAESEAKARKFLQQYSPDEDASDVADQAAFAMVAKDKPDAKVLDGLWEHWDKLALPARIAATRVFAQAGHPQATTAMQSLLQAAPKRGGARVLNLSQRFDRWMSSNLREQCALIDLLRAYPKLAGDDTQKALVAGLTDLYAGGIEAVDTQTGAVCLMALRSDETSDVSAVVDARIGTQTTRLSLPAGQNRVDWKIAEPSAGTLSLDPEVGKAPISFVAQLDYREDARQAQAAAVGFAIDRRHEVLRDRKWQPVATNKLREGDWVRITLVVSTSAPRYFVAVTDDVPGGLRPTDLSLGSVAGLELEALSDLGSYWFETRKLDPRSPRFYAEYLPAGRHQIHYFAKIGNSGDYLAAPALAELMYGSATRARTAAARLRIATNQVKP